MADGGLGGDEQGSSFSERALVAFSSCPWLTSEVAEAEVRKRHPGGSRGDDLSCLWVPWTGEEPTREVVGERVKTGTPAKVRIGPQTVLALHRSA